MFEADEEMKAIVVEKKEMQKIEDDAEKAEKHISNYVDKQMAMIISADKYKEKGLDKAPSQVKVNEYLKLMADAIIKSKTQDLVKMFQTGKPYIAEAPKDELEFLASQVLYVQDCNMNQGPFNRFNEPIIFTTLSQMPRFWDYDHLKYSNKRDPTIQEIEQAL